MVVKLFVITNCKMNKGANANMSNVNFVCNQNRFKFKGFNVISIPLI